MAPSYLQTYIRPIAPFTSTMTSADEVRFISPDGTHWKVYEITNSHTPWASTSLIFVSDRGFRRVYHYPRDWRDLDAEGLHALSWKT